MLPMPLTSSKKASETWPVIVNFTTKLCWILLSPTWLTALTLSLRDLVAVESSRTDVSCLLGTFECLLSTYRQQNCDVSRGGQVTGVNQEHTIQFVQQTFVPQIGPSSTNDLAKAAQAFAETSAPFQKRAFTNVHGER